jgi:hypothetical protein
VLLQSSFKITQQSFSHLSNGGVYAIVPALGFQRPTTGIYGTAFGQPFPPVPSDEASEFCIHPQSGAASGLEERSVFVPTKNGVAAPRLEHGDLLRWFEAHKWRQFRIKAVQSVCLHRFAPFL